MSTETTSQGMFTTDRRDSWWVGPLLTVLGLSSFGVYSFWAALVGNHYTFGPYLSPFYSPLIIIKGWPFSPAFLILWAPLGFRATCYYYRKAYYRSFFMDPPGCAVGEARHSYSGETKLFIFQNLHRFMFYLAVIVIGFLWYDVVRAFIWDGHFGMGLGTLIMLINVCLLSAYTFGCHSFRHLIGGKIDCFSCSKLGHTRFKAWRRVSFLNERHMLFAWCSLFTVGFTDLYIRLCSMGIFHDVRFF